MPKNSPEILACLENPEIPEGYCSVWNFNKPLKANTDGSLNFTHFMRKSDVFPSTQHNGVQQHYPSQHSKVQQRNPMAQQKPIEFHPYSPPQYIPLPIPINVNNTGGGYRVIAPCPQSWNNTPPCRPLETQQPYKKQQFFSPPNLKTEDEISQPNEKMKINFLLNFEEPSDSSEKLNNNNFSIYPRNTSILFPDSSVSDVSKKSESDKISISNLINK